MIFGRRNKFEQLELLDPREGTGMSDDPTNGPIRRGHIARMMGVGSLDDLTDKKDIQVGRTLDQSNVPLQHIADVANSHIGLRYDRSLPPGVGGQYRPMSQFPSAARLAGLDTRGISIGSVSPTVVTHEFGHALHDATVRRFSPHGWRDSPQFKTPVKFFGESEPQPVSTFVEGIAVGYSTKFSGKKDRGYRRVMKKAGPEHNSRFLQAHDFVTESGTVPFTYRDLPRPQTESGDSDGEQLSLGF
jgi:hypothetical protein